MTDPQRPAPEIHTLLRWQEVRTFDFAPVDFEPIAAAFPGTRVITHDTAAALRSAAATADFVLTWAFKAEWYAACPRLKAVFTPAAGGEWVAADPAGAVQLVHGTFHGRLLGESLLSALLFMNHRMPAMLENFRRRGWERNLQRDCRLLRHQTVVIVGLGHIGSECARLIRCLGARVIGIKRNPAQNYGDVTGIEVRRAEDLDDVLPEADHVAVVLPGGAATDRILSLDRIRRCRPGVYLYNFGRGNAIASDDIIAAADHIGGAFLDVVDQEPLDPASPLWRMKNVMITPHSSCVYNDYRRAFVEEVIQHLERRSDMQT